MQFEKCQMCKNGNPQCRKGIVEATMAIESVRYLANDNLYSNYFAHSQKKKYKKEPPQLIINYDCSNYEPKEKWSN